MGLISNNSLRLAISLFIGIVMFAVAGCKPAVLENALDAENDMQSRLAGTWVMDPEKSKLSTGNGSYTAAHYLAIGIPITAQVQISSGGKFNSKFLSGAESIVYDGPVTIDSDGNIDDSKLVGRDSAGVEQRDNAMATATFLQVGAAMEDDLLVIQDSSSDGATDVQLVLRRG